MCANLEDQMDLYELMSQLNSYTATLPTCWTIFTYSLTLSSQVQEILLLLADNVGRRGGSSTCVDERSIHAPICKVMMIFYFRPALPAF